MKKQYLNPRVKRINPAKIAYNNSVKKQVKSSKNGTSAS